MFILLGFRFFAFSFPGTVSRTIGVGHGAKIKKKNISATVFV